MIHDEFPTVSLHNVAETDVADWTDRTDAGHRLCRVPSSVRSAVNVAARERLRHPSGCELRFVPERDDETVSVTLSAPTETVVRPFWGEFQGTETHTLDATPTTLEFSIPERVRRLESAVAATSAFDSRVCRLRFDAWVPVAVHDVAGDCRPPRKVERPDRRYLAYGTSITEGASATASHLTYVSRVAREVGADALNLGVAGAAYCEPAIADHIATREDWDVATLAVSVNMANRGFTLEQFRMRAGALVDTVAGTNPDRPIVCVTLFPYHADACRGDDSDRATGFRTALRETVDGSVHENVSLVEGSEVVAATGLTTDLLHPGDAGMAAIGDGLTPVIRNRLEA